jgi:hypothetical protein
MAFSISATRTGCGLKSGKPCDRLIALCSFAKADMVVKMVVPTVGSFEFMVEGKFIMQPHPALPKGEGSILPFSV